MLDPDAAAQAAALRSLLPEPLYTLGIGGLREFVGSLEPATSSRRLSEVRDIAVSGGGGDIPCRLYRPSLDPGLPILLYIHGGGWVSGGLDGVDALCREFAWGAECVVLSVDYRLAPECPFPLPLRDCRAVYDWVKGHGAELSADVGRVAVAGDSAGGNLVAALCLSLVEDGAELPVLQVLAYPSVDNSFCRPSWTEHAHAPLLTAQDARWMWSQYVPSVEAEQDPLAAPMVAVSLSGMPPTLVITAEVDPLRDDGEAFAARLWEADVPTILRRFEGVFHGFFTEIGTYAKTDEALGLACGRLRSAFSEEVE